MLHARAKSANARTALCAALFSCLLAASTVAAGAAPQPHVVVFGDSLSDSGNLFAVGNCNNHTGNNVPPGYDLDELMGPNAAYARGGHHLSNGPTWIEDLALSSGYGVNTDPAWRQTHNPLAADYAVAGARANDRDGGTPECLDFADQVALFLQDHDGSAPADALYVVEFGGNDVRDALLLQDPTRIDLGLQGIATNIQALYLAGARHFLVLNAPNIGLLPSVVQMGAGTIATQASAGFNLALQYLVLPPLQALPGIDIRVFDLFATVTQLHDGSPENGLTVIDAPCITPDVPPFVCPTPDTYLFWDGIHPTKAVHRILADDVAAFLAQ